VYDNDLQSFNGGWLDDGTDSLRLFLRKWIWPLRSSLPVAMRDKVGVDLVVVDIVVVDISNEVNLKRKGKGETKGRSNDDGSSRN
jgi:hypothetical protein